MKVAMVGLGKLGLPVAHAISTRTVHEVTGYDLREEAMQEAEDNGIKTNSLLMACVDADIILIAVQTPHDPRFEGISRLTEERKDFDYTFLKSACEAVHKATVEGQIVVIISTVLPGTMEREIYPLLTGRRIAYNPSFIAMGTVEHDYLHPEFVLIGCDNDDAAGVVHKFYRSFLNVGIVSTTVRNAELIKVAYNTFIGMKLAFVNTLLQVCDKMGCNVDAVTDALKLADKRLISTAYLSAGMGDGGGCHPRDNIALSWLARELNLGFDFFGAMMQAREAQAKWLAEMMMDYNLPLAIYGTAFKTGINSETGSHALLVASLLRDAGHEVSLYDPHVDHRISAPPNEPMVVLIGMNHKEVMRHQFAKGSIVIDPWRCINPQDGVFIRRLGC